MSPSLRSTRRLPILIFALLPALLLFRALFLGEAFLPAQLLKDIAPWRTDWDHTPVPWNVLQWDGMAQFYPWRAFAADTLHHGYLPLWNPHQFTGTPFLANAQSAVLYPLNALFLVFPAWAAFGVSAWLHLTLTGWFAYLLLRRGLGRSRPAAVLGGVVWQLSTWQVSWLALPTFLCVSAWLPLALLLAHGAVTKPSAARGALLGGCLGLMLLAGHFQIWIYGFLLCAAYALTLLVQTRTAWLKKRAETAAVFGSLALALLVMAMLGSAQLIPSLELSRMSHRAGGAATLDAYNGYLRLAVLPFDLLTLFHPDFFGTPVNGSYVLPTPYPENACYIGVLGVLLAIAGILSWREERGSRFFSVAAVAAVLIAIGTPLAGLLYFGIPGFAQTGSPGRVLVLWSLCGAVLAAFGLDRILALPAARAVREAAKSLAVFAVVMVLCVGDMASWLGKNAGPGALASILGGAGDLWRVPVCILFVAGLALAAYKAGKMPARGLGALLILVGAADLLFSGYAYNPTSRPADVYPVTPAIAFLRQHVAEGRIMPVNRRWSMDAAHPPPAVLPPNAATVYGLDDLQGYDSLFPGQYMTFAAALNGDGRSPAPDENGNMVFTRGAGSDLARQAGARYIVTLGELPSEPDGLRSVLQDGPVTVYEDSQALPRFSTDTGARVEGSEDGPNRITLTPGAGVDKVVVRDQWYPGWRARIGDDPLPVGRGPSIFRSIVLPDTANRPTIVRLTFAPASVQIGIFALCGGLGILSALGAMAVLRRKPRQAA